MVEWWSLQLVHRDGINIGCIVHAPDSLPDVYRTPAFKTLNRSVSRHWLICVATIQQWSADGDGSEGSAAKRAGLVLLGGAGRGSVGVWQRNNEPMTPPTLVDAYTPHSMALADSHLSCILSLFASYTIDGSCWNWSTRTSDEHKPPPQFVLSTKGNFFCPKISAYILTSNCVKLIELKKGIRKVGFYTVL